MVVKQIDGDWLMLLSYWDGGWVILNVNDPANPVYVADFEYPAVDLELLQQFGVSLTPEGNAHQAEWTIDNRFIIGMDEFEITPPTWASIRRSPTSRTTRAGCAQSRFSALTRRTPVPANFWK